MSIFEAPVHEPKAKYPIRVAVLGCNGSIGSQTLSVARNHADKIQITALASLSKAEKVVSAAREFNVKHIAMYDENCRNKPCFDELDDDCEIHFGEKAVAELASLDCVDVVVVAVVGEVGIKGCYEALKANKVVACANKEPLVSGGDILMPLARPGRFIPVDSEHSAIFQCIVGEREQDVSKIWLTCSGGPFFGYTKDQLASVTAQDALAHPNWAMGPKITIDSASLMNKGLEVIEAHHLFNVDVDKVEVLVHRQSKIHSMVEFCDGQVKAQLGPADMRGAIQYALSYPERWDATIEPIDFLHEQPLTFAQPDRESFGCLNLAYEAGRAGGTLPCAMNAANEVVNAAFRRGQCSFLDIERVVETVMDKTTVTPVQSISHLEQVDAEARLCAEKVLKSIL